MDTRLILEVCVDSVKSAEEAVKGGADRLEVCGSLRFGGGVTPSLGLVEAIRKHFPDVPLMVMVRPRIGDFVYSESETEVMLHDINLFARLNVKGVVFGVLTSEGKVDVPNMTKLVEAAQPLEVTFHRAIDMSHEITCDRATNAFVRSDRSPYANLAVDTLSPIGCSRILTSGGRPTAKQGLERIAQLAGGAKDLSNVPGHGSIPSIMPGSGINPSTIADIVTVLWPLGCREYHLSAGGLIDGSASEAHRHLGEGIDMGGWQVWQTRAETVAEVRRIAEATIVALDEQDP